MKNVKGQPLLLKRAIQYGANAGVFGGNNNPVFRQLGQVNDSPVRQGVRFRDEGTY